MTWLGTVHTDCGLPAFSLSLSLPTASLCLSLSVSLPLSLTLLFRPSILCNSTLLPIPCSQNVVPPLFYNPLVTEEEACTPVLTRYGVPNPGRCHGQVCCFAEFHSRHIWR